MCKTKSTPRNTHTHTHTHTHTQHMRPTRNIHQVADNTDFVNYIEPPLVLCNNSELEEDIYLFRIKGQSSKYNIAKVNHFNLAVIIDSRSPLNILDKKLYTNIKPTLPLAASTTKIFSYWSKQPLPLLGTFKATVTVNHQQTTAKFYVTKGSSGTLLRKKTAESLDLLHICPVKTNAIQQHLLTNQLVAYNATSPHHYPPKASEPSTDHIVQACSNVFQETGN